MALEAISALQRGPENSNSDTTRKHPADIIGRTRLLFGLTHLALKTDSTRLITIMLAGDTAAPPHPGRQPGPSRSPAPRKGSRNLPVLLAGGGFKHGQYLHFDPQNPPPLCNLYVSMLQRLGIETDHFGTSNGTLPGLAMI